MSELEALAERRRDLLLAEIGALLHNLGKLGQEFVDDATRPKEPSGRKPEPQFLYRHFLGITAERVHQKARELGLDHANEAEEFGALIFARPVNVEHDSTHINFAGPDGRKTLKELHAAPRLPGDDAGRTYALGDFIEYHWSSWYPKKPPSTSASIARLYGDWTATFLMQRAHNTASGGEKEGQAKGDEDGQQQAKGLKIATAFGFDVPFIGSGLPELRSDLLGEVEATARHLDATARRELWKSAKKALQRGPGDTQWPINDVTVWDLGSSAAALFKAGAAQLLLRPPVAGPGESEREAVDEALRTINWRLLGVRFDGLAFLDKAHHVSDLLGRREALTIALNAVQDVLEYQYPLGNEVYRDENGSIFVVPDYPEPGSEHTDNRPGLLDLVVPGTAENLEAHLQSRFDAAKRDPDEEHDRASEPLDGELLLDLHVSRVPAQREELTLRPVLKERALPPLSGRPDKVRDWWSAAGRSKTSTELCTVCQLRPQGYGAAGGDLKKALDRNVCGVCLRRRGRRSQDWATNTTVVDRMTIWIDEATDINGRAALIAGRFDLADWLSGDLVSTLAVGIAPATGDPVRKIPFFARIRRIWETTAHFWEETERGENGLPAVVGTGGPRLAIRGEVTATNNRDDDPVGHFHVYDIALDGRALSVVWDSQDKRFITADNLLYLARQLGSETREPKAAAAFINRRLEAASAAGPLRIDEPGGYGSMATPVATLSKVTIEPIDTPYIPAISLLTEPRTFLAIVPADKALAVARAIRDKYEREMGRVRNRLRLDLGLVFFPRRTPLPAVLDAGRRMLEMPGGDERWTVARDAARRNGNVDVSFLNGVTWSFPAMMSSDAAVDDKWYPWFTQARAHDDKDPFDYEAAPLTRAIALRCAQQVRVRPSYLDFEFLDSAGRRLDVSYERAAPLGPVRRRVAARRHRPYLLDHLRTLDELWLLLTNPPGPAPGLNSTQLHALTGAIEAKRAAWDVPFGPEADETLAFSQFVREALANAGPGWWRSLTDAERHRLARAGAWGWLEDLASLHMSIINDFPSMPEQKRAQANGNAEHETPVTAGAVQGGATDEY